MSAHVIDRGRVAAVGGQILRDLYHRLVVAPLGGEQQPLGVQVVDDSDLVLAAAQADHVDTHHLDAIHQFMPPGNLDMMRDQPPELLVRRSQQRGCLPHRHALTKRQHRASKAAVKSEPGRAHGTGTCVVLPQPPQATRGTLQCSQTSNWKKSRCRQDRHSRSCTGLWAARQGGHAERACEQPISKSMRRLAVSSLTSSTTHGAATPARW